MKVYVINMKRSAARRAAIEQQLKECGLEYEIVEAVDGRLIADSAFDELIKDEGTFTKSQAGCMLSHLKAYEKIVAGNEEHALVLEDDVLIAEPELKSLLNNIRSHLQPNHITLLTYYWCREGKMILKKASEPEIKVNKTKYNLYNPHDVHGIGRAAAYILSRNTAQSIISYQTPKLICQADSWIVYKNNNVIAGVQCVYPMPVSENPQFGSEIGYTKGFLEKAGKKLVDIALNMNLPVISAIVKRKRINFAQGYKNIQIQNDK